LIEGRVIVTLGSSWDFDPTGKHQLMKRLSARNRIVWVNYHGSRRPTLAKGDIRTACAKLFEVSQGIRRVSDSIVQVTPMVLPGARHPLLRSVHEKMLILQIRRAIAKARGDRPWPVQVWSFAPDVPYLAGKFSEELFLYYCVDEFSEFEGYDREAITASERRQIKAADLVVAASTKLHRAKCEIRDDVMHVPHGVDFDHFASAWRNDLTPPPGIRNLGGPVFGFFGLLHHWVDIELLAEVARLRPEYHFVLIGEAKTDVEPLAHQGNVHLLGRRDYAELPRYCAGFDAAMMLFKQTAMTENVNPIKLQEYLAAGLPIVSTPLREAERFNQVITFGDSAESFASACDRVLVTWMRQDRERISRSVCENSWGTCVETLSRAVASRLAATGDTVSAAREEVGPWGAVEPARSDEIERAAAPAPGR
jgi:glycosyltransferase involved in cell wall biosynthesis